jgi:hypothetical protein
LSCLTLEYESISHTYRYAQALEDIIIATQAVNLTELPDDDRENNARNYRLVPLNVLQETNEMTTRFGPPPPLEDEIMIIARIADQMLSGISLIHNSMHLIHTTNMLSTFPHTN